MLRRIMVSAAIVLLVVVADFTPSVVSASPAGSNAKAPQRQSSPLIDTPGDLCCMGTAYDGHHWIMFGGDQDGVSTAKTWSWDGTMWTDVSPALSPCARKSTRMVWDGFHVMLYGGTGPSGPGCAGGTYQDTWIWDGAALTWHQVCSTCGPGPLFSEGMAFDQKNVDVVLFGGNSATFVGGPTVLDETGSLITPSANTYVWTGNMTGGTWAGPYTQSPPAPCPRVSPSLAYDGNSTRKKVLMFGGDSHGNTVGCPLTFDNDTWIFNGNTHKWSNCGTGCGTAPTQRMGQRMDWDPDNVVGLGAQIVMFGGNTSYTNQINETWTIDGGTWANCGTCTPPTDRCCVGLTYFPFPSDLSKQGLLFYGGQTNEMNPPNKTDFYGLWRFDGSTWACITTCGP